MALLPSAVINAFLWTLKAFGSFFKPFGSREPVTGSRAWKVLRSLWTQCVCPVSFLRAFISPLLATPTKAEAASCELATGDSQLLVD